jgi:hypothetical protein
VVHVECVQGALSFLRRRRSTQRRG